MTSQAPGEGRLLLAAHTRPLKQTQAGLQNFVGFITAEAPHLEPSEEGSGDRPGQAGRVALTSSWVRALSLLRRQPARTPPLVHTPLLQVWSLDDLYTGVTWVLANNAFFRGEGSQPLYPQRCLLKRDTNHTAILLKHLHQLPVGKE